jgi:hypothetical protein
MSFAVVAPLYDPMTCNASDITSSFGVETIATRIAR